MIDFSHEAVRPCVFTRGLSQSFAIQHKDLKQGENILAICDSFSQIVTNNKLSE